MNNIYYIYATVNVWNQNVHVYSKPVNKCVHLLADLRNMWFLIPLHIFTDLCKAGSLHTWLWFVFFNYCILCTNVLWDRYTKVSLLKNLLRCVYQYHRLLMVTINKLKVYQTFCVLLYTYIKNGHGGAQVHLWQRILIKWIIFIISRRNLKWGLVLYSNKHHQAN